ncbi:MAG: BfmA/BtgA family mobilization protein [Bacteroidota bacterium]
MEDLNIKTIRFTVETDAKLTKLADKYGRSKVLFFKLMVDYFYRTKKDPTDVNDELLKNAIIKGTHNLTGFIKTQEQTLLIPMKLDVDRMIGSQQKILDCFNAQILEHNRQSGLQQTEMLGKLKQIEPFLKLIGQQLQSKEQLKSRALLILEDYHKGREQLGLMASAKDREDLLKKARERINSL